MKALIQRVSSASVRVEDDCIASIDRGLLILIGFGHNDTHKLSSDMIRKILNLRVFNDETGRLNQSILDIAGDILVVSQFTLYGNCEKGRRPHFMDAMAPDRAQPFFEDFISQFKSEYDRVQSGKFGAHMKVSLENDGPVTLFLEKETS